MKKRKDSPRKRGRDPEALFDEIDSTLKKLDDPEKERSLRDRIKNLEHRYSIIQTLLDISSEISSTLDLHELLRRIVDAVVQITDCKRGFLMLCDEEGNLSFMIARNRRREELSEEEFRVSKSIIDRVAETGDPMFISNIQELNNFKDKNSIVALNINTAICIPLKAEERLVGVIYADSDHISVKFSESDLTLMKAFSGQAVVAIENAKRHGELLMSKKNLESQNITLQKKLSERYEFSGMVGRSQAMRSVFETIEKVAPLSTTVLIQGETGTGKELIAKAIHHNSPRKGRPMLSINCGAMPKSLLESELFGYRKGAFTGAEEDRRGLFEAADGGTLFLDEIGDMPVELQVQLLRVLQDGEVRRVGEERMRKVDVRVISATNRDLAVEVERGSFRRDLFYRLNVVPIHIPPLRERKEDILPLAEFFMEKYSMAMGLKIARLSRRAKELILSHDWPGNVRELEHAIERALALGEGRDVIDVDQFPQLMEEQAVLGDLSEELSLKERLLSLEKEIIRRMLVRFDGNVSKTADALMISRQQLYAKIRKFGLKA